MMGGLLWVCFCDIYANACGYSFDFEKICYNIMLIILAVNMSGHM